jgi:hypothetical protein
LSLLAYNLGNLWRRLVLPKRIDAWSLTSLQQRLVKTGGRLISYQEISELLSHNKLDIVLSLNCYQNLAEMVPLLAAQCVSMFQVLRVEKGGWWLPVLRNGLDCLGASAFSPQECTYIVAAIVMGIHITATANKPCDSSYSNPGNGKSRNL